MIMDDNLTITDVNAEDIDTLWPKIQGHIEDALVWGQDEYDINDIHAFLLSGSMRLWIAYDRGGMLHSSAVCQLRNYPRKTVCFVVLAAGGAFDVWTEAFDALEEWAQENGATEMAAYTRPGVAKKARSFGYDTVYTVVQKKLTDRRLH